MIRWEFVKICRGFVRERLMKLMRKNSRRSSLTLSRIYIYMCLYILFLKAFVYILYNTITFRFHLYVAYD